MEAVIVSAARTPIGKFGGALKDFTATELGAIAIRETVKRAGCGDTELDLVIMGQVLQAGCGQIPSRQATLKAGLASKIPSETINKVCASSFRALTIAEQIIRSGDAHMILAGGMESMSNTPYANMSQRWGQRMFNTPLVDLLVHDGLWCTVYDQHMAVHGGFAAREYQISRQEQDQWALRSQKLAVQAISKGLLQEEIVPVSIKTKKGEVVFANDECPRPNTSIEELAKLPALFDKDNTVTAGNAPGTNDAAAAIMLMSRVKAQSMNIKPLATIIGHAMVAEDARYIAIVPGKAINKLLEKVNMRATDIDLFEINEAFAAVALVSVKIANLDIRKVNVNGGAIAYGHPIGASGARIIMALVYEMRRRGLKYGIAAICSGAAQGDAILVRCDY